MNLSEKQYRQRISLGQSNNALVLLIAVCLIVFVGLAFLKAVWYFRFEKSVALTNYYQDILGWFTLPASFSKILSRPWTIITHPFVHDEFWKILANMLWLWCFGYIMQDMTGNRKIFPVFFYGAIFGAVSFLLAYQFIPSLQPFAVTATLMGASAGVMAVAVATTILSPGFRIFPMIAGGIPLWVLTTIYIISDLTTIPINDTGTLISHIAGGITGFLFIYSLRQGFDSSAWMNNFFDWVVNLFNPDKPKKGKKAIKEELFYKSTGTTPYKKTQHVTQERIDEILDKINQKGYHFLTEEEKDLLRRASKEEL